jgi:hypothetical protein
VRDHLNCFLKPEELMRSRSLPSKLGRVKPPLHDTFRSPPPHMNILGEFHSISCPRKSKPRVERCLEEPEGRLRRAPVRAASRRHRSSRCGSSFVRRHSRLEEQLTPSPPFNLSRISDFQRLVFNVSRRPVRRRHRPGPPAP